MGGGYVVELLAKTPCADLLPVVAGRCTLEELNVGPITLVAPFANRKGAGSQALKNRHGLGFPAANRVISQGKKRIIWFGPGQAMSITSLFCGSIVLRPRG
jgi:sarcosine oxidase subunit gamma